MYFESHSNDLGELIFVWLVSGCFNSAEISAVSQHADFCRDANQNSAEISAGIMHAKFWSDSMFSNVGSKVEPNWHHFGIAQGSI